MKTKMGLMLVGLAMFASCSNENELVETDGVIRLGVANEVSTRGMVNDLAGLAASGKSIGIYGVNTTNADASTASPGWTAAPLMQNVQTTGINTDTGLLSWSGETTYPTTDPLNVVFYAYYPYAAESMTGDNYVAAAGVSQPPALHFTLTGEEDLMWATPVLGNRTTPPASLLFGHKLTQLSFRLIDGEGSFSNTISSVTVNGNKSGVMNLETGALDWSASATDFTLSNGDITMPKDGVTYVTLPKTVMLQPDQALFEVTLTPDGTTPKTATIKPLGEPVFKAGKAYLITLRLTGNVPVQLGAEIIPWETGGVGEGVVE